MVSGVITSIKYNRQKTATKIRINSRSWVFVKDLMDLKHFGSSFKFEGVWKETKTCGKYLLADSQGEILDQPNKEAVLRKIKKTALKSGISDEIFSYENLLYPLQIMGKKALILRFLKWRSDKKGRYLTNPYLFYIKKELDFDSTELLVLLSVPNKDNIARLHAVCVYILEAEYKNGREALNTEILLQKASIFFDNEEQDETSLNLTKLFTQKGLSIVSDTNMVFLSWVYFLKKRALQTMALNYTNVDLANKTDDEDLKTLLRNRFSILSGGAGTGKTTLLKKLAQAGMDVIYSATTGKAAQLLGSQAVTIHSLLGYGNKGFSVKSIECDVLVVDEASMLDWQTLHAIVTAAPRVIFAGDPKQLPPIHGEPVFRKMLEILPAVTLTKNWRFQGNENNIADIEIIKRPDTNSIMNTAKSLARILSLKKESYQILSPVKGYDLGTGSLNTAIQRLLNPVNTVVTKSGIKIGDKVIVTRNIYKDGTMIASNGTLGYVSSNKVVGYIGVDVNENTVYVTEQDIELAYCLTVHKLQGSEFDNVIFIVPQIQSKEFLTDELMEVGQTRGRKKTYVLTI